jgi:hypothetical protein
MTPNLEYLAVNFYHHLLPFILSSTKLADKDNFQDLLFLSTALCEISDLRKQIKVVALWINGVPMTELNFDRPAKNVKKSMARNLRNAFKKIG